MNSPRFLLPLLTMAFLATGCAGVRETTRSVVGVSVRKLEDARANALRSEWVCTPEQCFGFTAARAKESGLLVLQENRPRLYLVITQIPGVVNSSEVGVFFVPIGPRLTRVEIASPSELAKRKLSQWLLSVLPEEFSPHTPQPTEVR
ncbi:MAG: hypothetical protein PHG55_06375 [Verrucomicrobiota bacterium]|jgi:hypothetical protein|nr:hypothetical protein [Verrucomicrobiota bacterium]